MNFVCVCVCVYAKATKDFRILCSVYAKFSVDGFARNEIIKIPTISRRQLPRHRYSFEDGYT